MRSLLRFLYYARRRGWDAFIGREKRQIDRLVKAGRVTIGVHTLEYSLPTIKDYVFDETTVDIGDYCSLTATTLIQLGGQHGTRTVSTYPHKILWKLPGAGQPGEDGHPNRDRPRKTVIGADVWTGDRTMIMGGVRVGHGAVVASGAIVTKDVPDFAIVGGVPAKVIGYRHTEEQRKELLEIAWWDWPEAEVRAAVEYLAAEDIDAFIGYAKERFPEKYPRRGPGER